MYLLLNTQSLWSFLSLAKAFLLDLDSPNPVKDDKGQLGFLSWQLHLRACSAEIIPSNGHLEVKTPPYYITSPWDLNIPSA